MRKILYLLLLSIFICTPSYAKRLDEMNANTSPDITNDFIYSQDVSDTSENSHGTGKSLTIKNLLKAGNITVDGTNVGINTISPMQQLQVVGTVQATSFVGDGSGLTGVAASASDSVYGTSWDGDTTGIASKNSLYDKIETITASGGGWTDGGTNIHQTTSTDNVGIGTINPISKLEVKGAITSYNTSSGYSVSQAPYEGLIATRGILPQAKSTNTQLMSRSVHFSRKHISSMKLAIPNWWVRNYPDLYEEGTGGNATVTASIEYPEGVFTQVLFNGSTTGTIPDMETLVSDYVNIDIPDNTQFWVRIYFLGTSVVYVSNNATSSLGSGIETGTSGITDKTMSGTVTSSNNHLSPIALIGWTDEPSIAILGDSKAVGNADTTADSTGDFGNVARSIGPNYAYMNLAKGGDRANHFVDKSISRNRRDLLKYVTHVISTYGYNDSGDDSAETIQNNLVSIWTEIAKMNKKVYQITHGPGGNSSDQFRTTVNQTPYVPNTQRKIDVNNFIRTKPSGLTDYFDVSDVVSSSRDSGLWAVDGTAFYMTADGSHESSNGYEIIRDSGVIPHNFATLNIFTNNGNVGVGTFNPSTALQVVGTVTATAFSGDGSGLTGISGGASGWTDGGTNVYTTTSTDSLGIGTTTPTGRIDIRGDEVRIWTGAGTNTNATSAGELYVESDLEVDGTAYIGGAVTATGAVTGSNLSGTNTGDQTSVSGNAGTATALAANPANCAAGNYPLGIDASGAVEDCTPAGGSVGIGTANTITFWPTTTTIGSLPTATYPSLTELSYVKGATSNIQTQIDGLSVGSGGWTDGGTNVFPTTTTDKVGIGTTTPFSDSMLTVKGSTATGTDDFIGLFVQNGVTPDVVGAGSNVAHRSIMVQGDGAAYIGGRDVTNDIEFFMGTSTLGVGFGGTTSNHPFQIRANGSSKIQVGTDGNVGIGTAVANARLTVFGTSTGAVPIQTWKDSGNTQRMAVLGNGTVGIGTAGPRSTLDVAGDVTVGNGTFSNTSANEDLYVEGNLEVDGTVYGNVTGALTGNADTVTTNANLSGDVTSSGNTTTIADSVTVTGWALGASTATTPAEDDNDTSIATTAYVQTEISGLGSGAWVDGGTNVYVSPTTDNVGIGTTTPSTNFKADIRGNLYVSGNVGIGTLLPRGTLDLGPTGTIYTQTITGPTGPTILGTSNNVGIGTIIAGSLLTVGSTGQVTVSSAGAVATSSTLSVADDAYAAGWNGSTNVPTKNAVYDKIETLGAGYWTDAGVFTYLTTTTDNVGIGTVAPDQRLKVEGGSAANVSAMVRNSDSSGLASVKVWNSANLGFEMVATGSGYAVPSTYGVLATTGESLSFGESDGTINMRVNPAGTVRFTPTDTPDTCNAGNEGSLYYDNSLNEFCDCDGSSWAQIDGGGAC